MAMGSGGGDEEYEGVHDVGEAGFECEGEYGQEMRLNQEEWGGNPG